MAISVHHGTEAIYNNLTQHTIHTHPPFLIALVYLAPSLHTTRDRYPFFNPPCTFRVVWSGGAKSPPVEGRRNAHRVDGVAAVS